LDAGNDETVRALNWPASKKRQGTKSRAVGHWLAASYVDLMLAPISIMGRTPAPGDPGRTKTLRLELAHQPRCPLAHVLGTVVASPN